jgi:hypothetical protein
MIFGEISLCPTQINWIVQIIVGIVTPFVLIKLSYWIYHKSNNSSHWNRPTYPHNVPIYPHNVPTYPHNMHRYTPPYEYPYVSRRDPQDVPQNVPQDVPQDVPQTKPQIDPQQESGNNKS